MKLICQFFLAMACAAFSLAAFAHGGDDHGSEATPAPSATIAPRAVSQTNDFELVAALNEKDLIFTLDRFATNEPVIDAQIEIESGALKTVATQVAPGTYSVSGEPFSSPGKHPLAISVQAGDVADLLTMSFDVPSGEAGVKQNRAWNQSVLWGGSGALLVAGAALIAVRRRKKTTITTG